MAIGSLKLYYCIYGTRAACVERSYMHSRRSALMEGCPCSPIAEQLLEMQTSSRDESSEVDWARDLEQFGMDYTKLTTNTGICGI